MRKGLQRLRGYVCVLEREIEKVERNFGVFVCVCLCVCVCVCVRERETEKAYKVY